MLTPYHTVLTIAGSDSSGGAGIQADIKSVSANGGVACSVITASTAQNTLGVTEIHPMPVSHVVKQLEARRHTHRCRQDRDASLQRGYRSRAKDSNTL